MNEEKLYFENQRTEQVQHIIERMPMNFGFWVSLIVAFLFILMILFGWFIRYPDVVLGGITVNANTAPIKLIANNNGKLKLNGVQSLQEVKEGQVIAYIENPTDPVSVMYIDSLLRLTDPNTDQIINIRNLLPNNFSLGELNSKYYAFSNSLQSFINYKKDKLDQKHSENLKELLNSQKAATFSAQKRLEMSRNNLSYAHKFYSRDSTLYIKKVISESELDKSKLNYLSVQDALQNSISTLISTQQAALQTEDEVQKLDIQRPQKEVDLRIDLISKYNDLVDNIKSWQQKYVFRAPFSGKVQFLKFYSENQFVQNGEEVFTVIPSSESAIGQLILPTRGAGKIESGQEVIVKLDNYPYMEYGSITGKVNSISLISSNVKTEKSEVDTYMILVDFPEQLKTNYGTTLSFKAQVKGTAEIITKDRRLIHRLFDNLKYIIEK